MVLTTIDNYLENLFGAEQLEANIKLSSKEIRFMEGLRTEAEERDKGLIANLNPSKDYCVVTIGKLHVPSAAKKLQELGYKTTIFLPKPVGTLADVVAYEKIKEELLEGLEKTKSSSKEALLIADVHTMIYGLEGVLKKPEELIRKGIKEVSVCLEHSTPSNANNYLFKNGKHCFNVYDELRNYAIECKKAGISLELVGLECRKDGQEIC